MGKNSLKTRPPEDNGPQPFDSAELRAVIDRAYDVFSVYTLVGPLDVCMRCCVSSEEADALVTTPLRQVSAGLLSQFNDTAQSKAPSFDQLKYFLPRYFELLAERRAPSHSIPIALHRLAAFPKERWTAQERACIDDFSVALFQAQLTSPPSATFFWDASTILLLFWKAGVDVQPLLAVWEATHSPTSLLDFAHLVVRGMDWNGDPPRYIEPFAEAEMSAPMVAWIRSDSVRRNLGPPIEALLLSESGLESHEEDRLSWAYEILHPA